MSVPIPSYYVFPVRLFLQFFEARLTKQGEAVCRFLQICWRQNRVHLRNAPLADFFLPLSVTDYPLITDIPSHEHQTRSSQTDCGLTCWSNQIHCHDFCPTLPLVWKEGTIDLFLEQAMMEEHTHSLNNYQNCDIYSFIHEERGDERLHSLVTGSDTSVESSPWFRIKG